MRVPKIWNLKDFGENVKGYSNALIPVGVYIQKKLVSSVQFLTQSSH